MNSKKKILKICSIALIALFVVLSLFSCKKKDSENKSVANPSALVNKDAVAQSSTSTQSIVTVPVPVTVDTTKNDSETKPSEIVVSQEKETVKDEPLSVVAPDTAKVEDNKSVVGNIQASVSPSIPQTPVFITDKKTETPVDTTANTDEVISEVENKSEAKEVTVIQIYPHAELVEVDDDLVIDDVFSYGGISAEITSGLDATVFDFNEPFPSIEFVLSVLDKVLDQYPMLSERVAYEFDGKTLSITYPMGYFGTTKDDIYGNLFLLRDILISLFEDVENTTSENLYSKDYQLYGKKVSITAGINHAFITSEDTFTPSEINEAIEIIKANYPEESKYVTYTLKDNGIDLVYPDIDESFINAALKALDDLILLYTPMPLDEVFDENITMEITSKPEGIEVQSSEDNNQEIIVVEALTEAGKKISNISLGLAIKGELDFSYPSSPFVLGFEARGEYRINNRFDAGLKLGYDLSGYLPITGYLKYNFSKPEGLYLFGEAGINFGVGGRSTGLILEAGVGYEVEVINKISIFGEAGLSFRSNASSKFSPYITIGAKYSF